MARSCHLPLWEAGGIVDSNEQCESIHLQPVSRRSEYLGLFDAGLYSSHNSTCSWSFFFPCNCPSSRGQRPLVSTLQYQSGDHNIIFVNMCFEYILPAHFIECFRKMLLECNDKIINTHHMPFSYCREMEVYGEPQVQYPNKR